MEVGRERGYSKHDTAMCLLLKCEADWKCAVVSGSGNRAGGSNERGDGDRKYRYSVTDITIYRF